ncbi:hypothetical protein ABMA08_18105 [Pseudomonas yamanorum]
MQGKTGVELSQELRAQLPALPILIIAGYTNLSQKHFGDLKVLTKPFHHQDLASTAVQMLKADKDHLG